MNAHSAVRIVAAFMILLSLALANLVHPAWLGLAAFVGANLFQFAFTGFCPAVTVLKLVGLAPACPGREHEAGRRAQMIVGPAVFSIAALGYFVPALGVPFATVAGGLIALSFGQSAFTQWCPALAVGRRWAGR